MRLRRHDLFGDHYSQGVALGLPVLGFRAAIRRAEGARQESPGQSEAPPRDTTAKHRSALKGRDKTRTRERPLVPESMLMKARLLFHSILHRCIEYGAKSYHSHFKTP